MGSITIKKIEEYIQSELPSFYKKRFEGLENLHLDKVLKKKNPYLIRVKHSDIAHEVVKSVLDAFISSSEEAIFGDWLEGLAIHVCRIVYGGVKSATPGIDLEFERDGIRYLVSIKSGPNWGNSSQVKKMVQDFVSAKRVLHTSNAKVRVEFINGCCYGKSKADCRNGIYFKYCGQQFWEFISGNKSLYMDIIEPLGRNAKLRNEEYQDKYHEILNVLTKRFIDQYCDPSGKIDWAAIVRLNSSYETSK